MDIPADHLLSLKHGNRSLEEHLEEFLNLAYQNTIIDNSLFLFLYDGLNTTTEAQLSGEGPWGSSVNFVEWSLFTVRPIDDDTSPNLNPVPSQNLSNSEERQEQPSITCSCKGVPDITEGMCV